MFWLRVKRQRCFSPLNWTASCLDPNSGIGKLFRCQLLIYRLSVLMQCLVSEFLCPLFTGCTFSFDVPPQQTWPYYMPLWYPLQTLLLAAVSSELISLHSVSLNQPQNLFLADGFNNEFSHEQTMQRPLPKVECKGWQNDFFKLTLSWILLLTDNTTILPSEHMLPISEPINIPL